MADIVFTPGDDVTADSTRLPWNNLIYPGNYVSRLNSYRQQGALAIPGVAFFQQIGAYVVPENTSTVATGNYTVNILSPDKRQDDKPRKDKPLKIPANAVVYRTAISAPNVKGASADTIELGALGSDAPATGTLTAGSDGFFPAAGVSSALNSVVDGTAVNTSSETTVSVTTSASLEACQSPSAGAGRLGPSAILVEVCYYLPAAAPTLDEVAVPYATEAGQGY